MRFSQYLVASFLFLSTTVTAQSGEIIVSGDGAVNAIPDVMTVSWSVTAESPNAGAAYQMMSDQTLALFSALERIGVPRQDVQTNMLNISERYSQKLERTDGYSATTGIEIRLVDLTKMDAVINLASQDGMGTVRGISFDIADPAPYLMQARKNAVQDAMNKADVFAQAAGQKLGKVLHITEGGQGAMPMPMMDMVRSAKAPIALGNQSVSSSVTITFELVD